MHTLQMLAVRASVSPAYNVSPLFWLVSICTVGAFALIMTALDTWGVRYRRRGGLRFVRIGRLHVQWSVAKPERRSRASLSATAIERSE